MDTKKHTLKIYYMKKTFETLYTRDIKGKILQWRAEIQVTNQVDISISYGEYGGEQTLTWERNIQGKNIGKSNETDSFEQAELQVLSRINRQRRRGYMTLIDARDQSEDQDDARPRFTPINFKDTTDTLLLQLDKFLPKHRTDLDGNIKPMKCQQYYRKKKDWIDPTGKLWDDRKYYYLENPYVKKEEKAIITKFPCIAQPKINGVRATIQLINNTVIIKSKEGLKYIIPQINDFCSINNDIFNILIDTGGSIQKNIEDINIILDGELYIHGEALQDITSAVKKSNLNTPRIKFILFDLAIPNKDMLQRWSIIKQIKKNILDQHINCPIEVIESFKISSDKEAQTITDKFIKRGYEGTIFRDFKGIYAFGKRPQQITKLKRIIDEEFTIVDIVPQSKDPNKGMYSCINKKGLRFEVTAKGTNLFKEELLINKQNYIGKSLTCSFYEYTNDGKPLHIINNIIRDYE